MIFFASIPGLLVCMLSMISCMVSSGFFTCRYSNTPSVTMTTKSPPVSFVSCTEISICTCAPTGRLWEVIHSTSAPLLIKVAAAPILYNFAIPVYRLILQRSTVEYKSSAPFMTIAEFIMRIAVSTENPASKKRSTRSKTISLSLHAMLPDPIPSESPSRNSPRSNSRKEKLSPDIFAPSFLTRAIPCTLRYTVSS